MIANDLPACAWRHCTQGCAVGLWLKQDQLLSQATSKAAGVLSTWQDGAAATVEGSRHTIRCTMDNAELPDRLASSAQALHQTLQRLLTCLTSRCHQTLPTRFSGCNQDHCYKAVLHTITPNLAADIQGALLCLAGACCDTSQDRGQQSSAAGSFRTWLFVPDTSWLGTSTQRLQYTRIRPLHIAMIFTLPVHKHL